MWESFLSGSGYKFQCGLYNESYLYENISYLDIRSREQMGVSPLTGRKVKTINNSAIRDHLLHYNYLPSFDNFSILAHDNKKLLLEIKETLLLMRDKPSLDRNISSAPLYLFDKVSERFLVHFMVVHLTSLIYFLLTSLSTFNKRFIKLQ